MERYKIDINFIYLICFLIPFTRRYHHLLARLGENVALLSLGRILFFIGPHAIWKTKLNWHMVINSKRDLFIRDLRFENVNDSRRVTAIAVLLKFFFFLIFEWDMLEYFYCRSERYSLINSKWNLESCEFSYSSSRSCESALPELFFWL